MIGTLSFSVLLLLAASGVKPVPPPADTVLVLPEVRVERDRPLRGARARAPSAFASDLAAGGSGRALETLGDLLATAPGVRVTQYGGLGAFSTVSLRGAPAGQVAVYLDGAPIQSAAAGVVNLSDLPFAAVERVEVYRGGGPLELGAGAAGGIVNLVSRTEARGLEASVVRGSFGTWASRAAGGLERGALSVLLLGGYQGTRGDFRFHDDNATPFNADDDSTVTRLNNRLDAANALLAATWRAPADVRVALRQHLLHRAQGVPGLGASPALHPRLALDRALSQLDVERAAAAGLPALRARASWQDDRTRFRDTAAELRPGRTDRDDRQTSGAGTFEVEWPAGRWLVATAALAARDERFAPHDALSRLGDPPASTRRTRGATLGLTLVPWSGPLLLRAAGRWDRLDDRLHRSLSSGAVVTSAVERELRSPQLGARLRLPARLEVRANWTDAARAPDFTELFGDQGSVQGNPTLAPERGENWDAGARWEGGRPGALRASVEAAHFESDARDLVVWLRNSPSTVRASNVSRAAIDGEELSVRLEAGDAIALTGSGTRLRAVDRGKVPAWYGRRLPQRPDAQGSLRLDLRWQALRVGLMVDHLGANWLDPSNRRRVAPRTLLGAAVGARLRGETLALTLDARNLADREAADVAGFPLPGRSVFAALEYHFGRAIARP